jgi:hypothetical protein
VRAQVLKDNANLGKVRDLLKSCIARKERAELNTKTGTSERRILRWAKTADLFCVSGTREEHSDLRE